MALYKGALITTVLTVLRWSLSIGNKFFRVVPAETILVIVATLVSQVTILLAFLLPLKILILLGSTGVPRYFPSFFEGIGHDLLVVLLSFAAIVFYFIYHLAEKVVALSADRGSKVLLERNQKIALFDNQEEVASRGYQRYSRSLAGSVFLLLVALALIWLYPELLAVLVGFSVMVFLFFAVTYENNEGMKGSLDDAPGRVVNTATGMGFLLTFGFMVAQFLMGEPPSLLVAIISLILMRQGFSRLTALVNDLKGLYTQRFKLNALFFHGHVLINESKRHENNFWSLLDSSQREQWLVDILKSVVVQPISKLDIEWWQLGGQDIACLRVCGFDDGMSKISDHMIKVFNTNRKSLAKHEATLLSVATGLPALSLTYVDEVGGLHCHVFEWEPVKKIPKKQLNVAKQKMVEKLLSVEPAQTLVSQFKRSRPPIWQRVDSSLIARLLTVAEMLSPKHVRNVERFGEKLPLIMNRLRELPLTIINPEFGPETFLETEEKGELVLAHWGRWSLEPVGANWPVEPKLIENIAVALESAKTQRVALHDVGEKDLCLSALVFSLERFYARQAYVSAIKMIPRILSYFAMARKENQGKV
ncbi:hypothetical protein KZO83_05710 [Chromohalobacter sp. TMW 2.2308]|uniref:hypothetical protein n=1 Tax=Chromohalobacter TaxID=42054 RepID=UPI001FFDC4A5|nr:MULTISPECIES: hypothetical protein [Chromohalobacter]MCK2042179.1 hypothetical protein [Chromohalobacter moromii]MCT8514327.1 hypothetical protein [Chromohalobacter sp. TMW 2.2271]